MARATIIGWLVAALLGAMLAITADRLINGSAPLADRPTASEASPPPPAPIDPGPARSLVVGLLAEAGVPHKAMKHGLFPLRGAGRTPDETLPLVSFTCPAAGCGPLLATMQERAAASGLRWVEPSQTDRPGRPWYRALAGEAGPALAVRALPPGPRLTVIVGDIGQEPALLDAVMALDADVTLAVMANAPHAPAVAERLSQAGRELIAHLPMEPLPPVTADGGQFLTTSADPAAVAQAAAALLDRVPGAVGADNHLGGRLTTSRPHIGAVLEVLGERGLYFVDGRASEATVAGVTARSMGIRGATRSHAVGADPAEVAGRLKAIEVALVLDGQALVVVTPSPEVLAALGPWLGSLRQRGIRILRASEIVR